MPVMTRTPSTEHAVRPSGARRGVVVAGLITAGMLGAPLVAEAALMPAAAAVIRPAAVPSPRMMPRDGDAGPPRQGGESDWALLAVLGGVLVAGAGAFSVYLVRRPA